MNRQPKAFLLTLLLTLCSTQTVNAQFDWLNLPSDSESTPLTPPFGNDWTVRAGAMFLQRSDNNADTIIRDDNGLLGDEILNASDMDLGTGIGWDVSLFGPIDANNAFEVRYFQLDGFDFDTRLSNPGGLGFNVIPAGIGLFGGGLRTVDISYSAEVQNGEVNGRYRLNNDVTLIYGIRHIQHDELLNGFFTNPANPAVTNDVTFEAENFLTGPQIGLDLYLLQWGSFRLEGLIKTGNGSQGRNCQVAAGSRERAGSLAKYRCTDSVTNWKRLRFC